MLKKPRLSIILLIISCVSFFQGKSQEKKWEFGIVTGAGIKSIVNRKDLPHYNFKGYNAGISARFRVTSKFVLSANLIYDSEFYKSNIHLTDNLGTPIETANIVTRLNYAVLPIMAGWHFGNKTKFMINAGGYVNYFINGYTESKGQWFYPGRFKITNLDKFSSGLCLGLGILQPLSERMILSLEFRDYAELSDLAKKGNKNYFFNYATVLAGLSFKF